MIFCMHRSRRQNLFEDTETKNSMSRKSWSNILLLLPMQSFSFLIAFSPLLSSTLLYSKRLLLQICLSTLLIYYLLYFAAPFLTWPLLIAYFLSSPSLFIQGGRIALHKAARFGQTSVTRYLVELGVNVNATDDVSQWQRARVRESDWVGDCEW